MGFSRRQLLSAGALLAARRVLHGQEEPVFSTDVKVVNVLATVLGRKGEIIRNLDREDFLLSENRRPQIIRYFARQSDLPLTLGLLVDTSMSQERVLNTERGACFRFVDQVLRESMDQVFVLQFDMAVIVRQALTSSRGKLDESLAFVDTPTMNELQHQSGGGTLLYDAVVQASKDFMKSRQGRKALIVLSDGVDIGSEATLAEAAEAAQRADTLVYSILFSDAGAYGVFGMGSGGRSALVRLARETGGGFFEVSKKLGIERIFGVIQEELRSQYSLGYVSDVPVRISEFRRIELTTRQKGLVVQARDRYWARR